MHLKFRLSKNKYPTMADINDRHFDSLKLRNVMVLQLCAVGVHFSVYDKFHLTKTLLRDKSFSGDRCQL